MFSNELFNKIVDKFGSVEIALEKFTEFVNGHTFEHDGFEYRNIVERYSPLDQIIHEDQLGNRIYSDLRCARAVKTKKSAIYKNVILQRRSFGPWEDYEGNR